MMNLDTEVLFNGMMLRKFRTLQYREVTQKYGLQVIDLIVLRFLSGSGSRNTLADMEKLCLFTKGHLSQSVKRLQESGYLRSETDPKDRRRVHNYLTDKSAEVVADFNAATDNAMDSMLRGFSDEEKEELVRCIRKINSNIQDYIQENTGHK
ncbi:MAG: MarR family winged helix-turn-helix transcriptional regulator [Lachnospiraceae bacterium]|jgi:DNA-binding MarR family transcriptional regulator